jgi:hypothetical protein
LLFALLALGVVAPYELLVLAATGRSPFARQPHLFTAIILSTIEFVVVSPLISALYVHAARSIAGGQAPRLAQVAVRGLVVLPTVAAAEIVATLGIALGALAFIIPGVILLIRWAVVAQVAAVDNLDWVTALRRGGELTAGNYLHVLGVILASGFIALLVSDLAVTIARGHVTVPALTFGIAVETIARSFVALTLTVLFFDLLARKANAP